MKIAYLISISLLVSPIIKDIREHPRTLFFNQSKEIKFEVVSQERDNTGFINQLFIFIDKMSNIKELNERLLLKYKKNGVASLQIYYFDNRQVASAYQKLLFNNKASDNQIEKMSKHLIGKFEFTAFNNSQSLHIGEDADLY